MLKKKKKKIPKYVGSGTCPKCGNTMEINFRMSLLSNPTQNHAWCRVCGYRGYVSTREAPDYSCDILITEGTLPNLKWEIDDDGSWK